MRNYKKSVKFTLTIINISMFVIFALAIALPWIITWYVEIKGKDPGLPVVVMLTCYPCVPIAETALYSLRKIMKNILNGLIFGDRNIASLRTVSICCTVGGLITLIAGYYYMPFYVISIASFGCAIIVKAIKDTFAAQLENQREELYESVREEL